MKIENLLETALIYKKKKTTRQHKVVKKDRHIYHLNSKQFYFSFWF